MTNDQQTKSAHDPEVVKELCESAAKRPGQVFVFGIGAVIKNKGTWNGLPALFVKSALDDASPDRVGQKAPECPPEHKHDVQPGEIVLVFTSEQSVEDFHGDLRQAVLKALVRSAVRFEEG